MTDEEIKELARGAILAKCQEKGFYDNEASEWQGIDVDFSDGGSVRIEVAKSESGYIGFLCEYSMLEMLASSLEEEASILRVRKWINETEEIKDSHAKQSGKDPKQVLFDTRRNLLREAKRIETTLVVKI